MRGSIAASLVGLVLSVAVPTLSVGADASTELREAPSLTSAAPIEFSSAVAPLDGAALVARAGAIAEHVPVPVGGNFNGVRWPDLGTATDADIAFILQYNAACQWLRAAADGRDSSRASAVWNEIPDWPAMRIGGNAAAFVAALAALQRGDAGEPDLVLLRACRESHERESSYARTKGLPAST